MTKSRPKGWALMELGEAIASSNSGVSVGGDIRPRADGEHAVLRTSCVATGIFRANEYKVVTGSDHARLAEPLQSGSILVSRANTPELVGASAYVACGDPTLFLSDKLWQLRTNSRAAPRYLSYCLASETMRKKMRELATGSSASMRNISKESFLALPVLLPPISEQQRIAEVLAIWDRAIASAEALVAAKRSRASALAAPLVWIDDDPWVSLEEVLTQSSTRVGPDLNPPIFSVSKEGLSPQEDRFNKRIANEDLSRHMLVLPGQLALSGLNFWLGSVAVSEEPGPICISPDYKVFDIGKAAVAPFFKHVVRSKPFRDLLIACSTERASVVRRNFNRELFLASEIPLPDPETQSKRAELLGALHKDVRLAGRRLESLRAQKRGLMQKLLTGEWRLPHSASEHAA